MAKKPAKDKPDAVKKLVTKKESGPKGGAPEIVIDIEALIKMVEIQCTAEECAAILGVSVDTIDRRLKDADYSGFADFYKKHSEVGKKSLRRAQWEVATLDRNPTMLVWLGKQVLNQKDKQEVEHNISDDLAALLDARRQKATHTS